MKIILHPINCVRGHAGTPREIEHTVADANLGFREHELFKNR